MHKQTSSTPTWSELLPAMLEALENPDTCPLSKKIIEAELTRMAHIADQFASIKKKEKLAKEETITYTLPHTSPK